jgi:3-hydroxybutyryl-CoA dehydrogenase
MLREPPQRSPEEETLEPQIRRVAVVGAGLMGANIALEFALSGRQVTLTDSSPEQLAAAARTVETNLALLCEHGLAAEAPEAVLARLEPRETLEETVGEADLVIEAVTEDLALKRDVFKWLDFFAPRDAVLASNTSSFMPSSLARGTQRPARVLVAHYWNPAHLIPLVELVPGPETAPETVETLLRLYREMGKRPVVVRKEKPGFIGNRLQFALMREALALVDEGVASPEEIDTVLRAGFGRRLPVTGLFGTADLAGLDTLLAICRVLFPDLSVAQQPGPSMPERVRQGRLGVKTGAGWYDYTDEEAAAVRRRLSEELIRLAMEDREPEAPEESG